MLISGCGRRPCATRWPSSARRRWSASVAENGVDPTPLWKTYVDAGWTELTDPENAVELAIVLEELGRADRSDPVPGDVDPVRAAGRRPLRSTAGPAPPSTAASPPYRDADGWVLDGTARHVLDGDRAERLAVVTDGGVFLVDAGARSPSAAADGLRPGAAHRRGVLRRRARRPTPTGVHVDAERARHVALTGMAITMVGACQRILDLVLEHVKQPPAVRRARSDRSRRSSTRPSTCTSPSSGPARCPTSPR